MKKIVFFLIPLAFAACKSTTEYEPIAVEYPNTKKVDHADTYFGKQVSDPYRWLEDDNAAEVGEWVKEENTLTQGYLSKIPFRQDIEKTLTAMWNYPKSDIPMQLGEYYLQFKNDGIQNQSVLYIKKGLQGEEKVFLDPNTLAADGTISIGAVVPSNDKQYVAYMLSTGGSDWSEIKVKDINGTDLKDNLHWIKFSSIAWYKDGFFYSAYGQPKGSALSVKNEYHKIYYHKLGTDQKEDKVVFEDKKNPLRNFFAIVTEDERFLLIAGSQGTSGNNLIGKRLDVPGASFLTIVEDFANDFSPIGNQGDTLYLQTNYEASNGRLIAFDFKNPKSPFLNIIPEGKDLLQSVSIVGSKLLVNSLHNACNLLSVFDMHGKKIKDIDLPALGTVNGISGSKNENQVFYSFLSFTIAPQIYTLDMEKIESKLYYETKLSFSVSDYVTEQIFYTSKDGTKVPMFVVYKKGMKKDGKNPLLLYAYGGFNVSMAPRFNVSNLLFLENGGIYVCANIRGGGEFGKTWHDAGTKLQKQNVFDDFIAAAEYLIENKYTNSQKIAIEGGSNGGLLVGACMTQRPELFKVALPAVGVMDMLRFHKFTIGWAWTGDYGSSEDSVEFNYLLGYSPLHNIKEGVCYPATLVTTGDHDDRVVPAHSFKFIASLQAAQAKTNCNNPALIRIETMAGHGAGKPTAKKIQERSDIWAFVFYNLNMKFNPVKMEKK